MLRCSPESRRVIRLLGLRPTQLRLALPRSGIRSIAGASLALGLALCAWLPGAANAAGDAARALITTPIDEARLVRFPGNTRPEATAARDRGRVPEALHMENIQLLMRRPAEREAALRKTLDDLHDRSSPNFHRWLSAAQLGERYGLEQSDLDAVSNWLRQQGFTVNGAYPSTLFIDFSGTAGQVRAAFHTEIHYLDVGGERHIANMSDPQLPAALAPAVVGIISLHDFRPRPYFKPKPAETTGTSTALVVPADLATIYSLSGLFSSGITGTGQTIAVIEDSDVYGYTSGSGSPDWNSFRSVLGLSSYGGTFTQVQPPKPKSGGATCSDPGAVNGDEFEAILDAEWASAAAPGAAIEVASCANASTSGVLIALENIVHGTSLPAIISISYGGCEASNGTAFNAAFNSLYQLAVAGSTSVFVSSGDEGAAGCDAGATIATHGIGVNGLASTAYNVAVGGTDFGDNRAGTFSTYWNSGNSATFGSALSYVPEIPWNDSCASSLQASYRSYSTTYGSGGFCNSSTGEASYLTTASGSGGPSGCATGTASTGGVVSGSCAGYAKPSWQSLVGNPSDGVRDLPDVSLFAANGIWGHYYVVCDSDPSETIFTTKPCTLPSLGLPLNWSGGGGTSFAAPIMAGIQALVNQKTGAKQGNPNPVYYAIAAAEYGTHGNSGCNSSLGNATSSGCVFYDVTQGDIDVNCTGSQNCYLPSGTNGVLSTSGSTFSSAFAAAPGWDFATGIGTVNAENLVNAWNASDLWFTGGGSVTAGGNLSYSWTVGNSGPRTATSIVLSTTVPPGMSIVSGSSSAGCAQSGQIISCTISSLGIGATTPLTIVIQPGAVQTVNLTFTLTASNGVVFPTNDSVATSLNLPGDGDGGSDGPLPLWADIALGVLLLGAARRAQRSGRAISD